MKTLQHPETMRHADSLLLDSKYFPGHPSMDQDSYSPSFGRKDVFSHRKQREFIPENKKDESYWDRRRRNNEAAKRSREKRRWNDMILETRVLELTKDNHILQAQLDAIYEKYGIKGETMISLDQVLSKLPTNEQVLNFTKKRMNPLSCPGSPLPLHSLSLPPLTVNNNNNNTETTSRNSVGLQLPPLERTQRSLSPYYRCEPNSNYPNIISCIDQGQTYIRSFPPAADDDEPNDDRDSGLALNLSTDRAGSDGRSSIAGSPPVTSSNILEREESGSSSGDESGYPRSLHSGESSLPHKLRFKTLATEKEAVNSLLSLHQIAMMKREPVDHVNHWIERMEAGGLGGAAFFSSVLPGSGEARRPEFHEPTVKRPRQETNNNNLTDEVARLTNEVATLKSILVTKMKDKTNEK